MIWQTGPFCPDSIAATQSSAQSFACSPCAFYAYLTASGESPSETAGSVVGNHLWAQGQSEVQTGSIEWDIMSQRFTVHSVQLSIIFMNMLESLTDQFASLSKK